MGDGGGMGGLPLVVNLVESDAGGGREWRE